GDPTADPGAGGPGDRDTGRPGSGQDQGGPDPERPAYQRARVGRGDTEYQEETGTPLRDQDEREVFRRPQRDRGPEREVLQAGNGDPGAFRARRRGGQNGG